ncbi:hypothetical protein Tco_1185342 [Tanacetum coccineum]
MITITSKIEDKNLLGLILPKNTMETFLYVQDAPYITQEFALSSVELATISAQKQTTGPQENILRDELNFVHFRISTLETTLEDIQLSSESSSI